MSLGILDLPAWSAVQRRTGLALLAAIVALLGLYFGTWADMVRLWRTDTTFSHAFLIAPLAAYLMWLKRDQLAAVEFGGSWLGIALLVSAALCWLVGHLLNVAAVEQASVVVMLIALFWSLLGTAAARVLLFPLLFLLFLVPVGKMIVPVLMEFTAAIALFLCRLTGIPVVREGMYLQIPAGTYEVAKACSGVKFFVAAGALSTFYAYVTYTSWRKRLLYVALFLLVAILMNGLRAYTLVLIGHVTEMRWQHDQWHIWLGYLMFAGTILFMMWIGGRYADPLPARPGPQRAPAMLNAAAAGRAPLTVVVWLVAAASLIGFPLASRALSRPASQDSVAKLVIAPSGAGWQRVEDVLAWRPYYAGALAETGAYYVADDEHVDFYIGAYQIGGRGPAEMITYRNRIQKEANESLFRSRKRQVSLADGRTLTVAETVVPGALPRLVWYWFDIGGETSTDPYAGKLLEGVALLRGEKLERVVVLSAQSADAAQAEANLESFVRANAAYFAAFAE